MFTFLIGLAVLIVGGALYEEGKSLFHSGLKPKKTPRGVF